MLTPSGWLSLVFATAAIVLGRILVLTEVTILGAVIMLLVAASVLAVWVFCPKTKVRRHHPSSIVAAGQTSEVVLEFEKKIWPPVKLPMRVQDSFYHYKPGAEAEQDSKKNSEPQNGQEPRSSDFERFTATFNILRKSESVAYSFTPQRRGVIRFGPLTARASDPFGIARRRWREFSSTEILVLPPIEDVIPPQTSLIAKSQKEDICSIWQGSPSGDFLTLREYTSGDDLRHVHWKSSAKTGDLMIRQSEHRRESGAFLLLDTRSGAASEQDFEKMVGAAASLCVASRNHRMPLHLATFHMEPVHVRDEASLLEALRELALVAPSAEPSLPQEPKQQRAAVLFTGDRLGSFAGGVQNGGIASNAWLRVCFGENLLDASWMRIPAEAKFADVWNSYFWKSNSGLADASQPGEFSRVG